MTDITNAGTATDSDGQDFILTPPVPRLRTRPLGTALRLRDGRTSPDGSTSYAIGVIDDGGGEGFVPGETTLSDARPAWIVLLGAPGVSEIEIRIVVDREPPPGACVLRTTEAGARALATGEPVILRGDGDGRLVVDAGEKA